MIIAIILRGGEWHFAEHRESGRSAPDRLSVGYRSKGAATEAAIERFGVRITLTGAADRRVCRRRGVQYRDPRGNKRAGSWSEEVNRQSGRLWAKIKSGEIATNGDFTRAIRRLIDELTEDTEK